MESKKLFRWYNEHNPVVKYAIRPSMKLVDAHNHPLRGGIASAAASGLAHYAILEAAGQISDYIFGTNFRDSQTKLIFSSIPWQVHLTIAINMGTNVSYGIGYGIEKYLSK